MKRIGWLLLALACVHCDKPSSDSRNARPQPGSATGSSEAPRANRVLGAQSRKWLELVRASFPGSFCEERTFFRQCFDITEAACKERVAKYFESCLAKHPDAVPAVVDEETGRAGGEVLGACVGTEYERDNVATRTRSARCDDAANWTQ